MKLMAVVEPYLNRLSDKLLKKHLTEAQIRTFGQVCSIAKHETIRMSDDEIVYFVKTMAMLKLIDDHQRYALAEEIIRAQMQDQLDAVLAKLTP